MQKCIGRFIFISSLFFDDIKSSVLELLFILIF